ncbi:MAG: T9SS type A sorting domain-containing protein [Salibacteraceae bacterium]
MKSIVFLLFCFTITSTSYSQYTTLSLASCPEKISNNSVCGAIINGNKFIYSFGGIDTTKSHSGIHNRCYKYSVTDDAWQRLPDLPISPTRIASGASVINNVAYIIGGYHVFANGNEQSSNLVHRLNLEADTFLTNGMPLPVATDDHVQAVYKDSLIYVITGWSQNTNINNTQIYDPQLDSWLVGTPVPNNHSFKSFGSSGAIIGDTLYYLGGARMGLNFPITHLLRKGYINPSNPIDIIWSVDTLNADLIGYRMAASTLNNKIIWFGGSNKTYNYNGIAYQGNTPVNPNNRILIFDPALNSWDTTFYPEINMDFRGVASFDCDYYLIGGMESNQKVSNRCLKVSCNPNTVKEHINAEIGIFPNPNSGSFIIKCSNYSPSLKANLYSSTGLHLMSIRLNNEITKVETMRLNPGIYYLWVESSTRIKVEKIIIQ